VPNDHSRPPRPGGKSRGAPSAFSKFGKKPFPRRDRAEGEDREEGGHYRKPFGQRPEYGGGSHGYREGRPAHRPYDDELFAASGKVAEIVGSEPQSRYDMLRKLWDFFREERLVVAAGRRVRANADDWRGGEERPPRERPAREPFEERPRRERPARDNYEERPPRGPRKPAGNHPSVRKAKSLEDVPRRKYKETRGS
jgi:hypothetical protein